MMAEPLWKVRAELPAEGTPVTPSDGAFKSVDLLVSKDDLVPILRTLIWSGARVVNIEREE